jgi:teichoic acid transport system permease protein
MLNLCKRIGVIPVELYRDRKLIGRLSYNDFKTRFSGSFFGMFWAFVQPVVMILVFWFVFGHALGAGREALAEGVEVPFVLFLVSGLVPWFFFSESLTGGTNALLGYSYLVKKVVFKISILPIVKVFSSLFVHVFFVGVILLLFLGMGYFPGWYALQVIYYSLGLFLLVLALSYLTCSVVVFFKDLKELINIGLMVGIWMTPILWNLETMTTNPTIIFLFNLNPVYYVISGYRNSLISQVGFWERPLLSLYFWGFVIVMGVIGMLTFKRLKIHFADVL